MNIRIGISGWVYPPWRKTFYPVDLPQKKELAFASRQINSIEINGSFYSYQKPETYKRWYQEVPKDFVFSVKGPQYITHILRLREPRNALANFFASGVLYLQEKLGAFLWQLPPNFLFDSERIEDFFKLLPENFEDACKIAQDSERFDPQYPPEVLRSNQKIHHALEVRHHSFENPDFIALLRKYNIALVFADTAGIWPYMEDITSDFLYLRLHGDEEIYKSGYDAATLHWWADRIELWARGQEPQDALSVSEETPTKKKERDIFVYFDNDVKIKAPRDARTLTDLLSL